MFHSNILEEIINDADVQAKLKWLNVCHVRRWMFPTLEGKR